MEAEKELQRMNLLSTKTQEEKFMLEHKVKETEHMVSKLLDEGKNTVDMRSSNSLGKAGSNYSPFGRYPFFVVLLFLYHVSYTIGNNCMLIFVMQM